MSNFMNELNHLKNLEQRYKDENGLAEIMRTLRRKENGIELLYCISRQV